MVAAVVTWWGIKMDGGPLGVGWFVETIGLPKCIPRWPARFLTRREAREAAKALTAKYAYLKWRFHPIRLSVSIIVEGSA